MTIKVRRKLTPELLISAPRPSSAAPNAEGTLALYTVEEYELNSHTERKSARILDIGTGKTSLFSDDQRNSSYQWLIGSLILWQRKGENGSTELWIGSAKDTEERPYLAGSIASNIDHVKIHKLPSGVIALAFTAAADANQNLSNEELEKKPRTTAREWEDQRPRCWDAYVNQYRSVLWYTNLRRSGNGEYTLSKTGPINALRDTGLALPYLPDALSSPDFDISRDGLMFATVDPEANEWKTRLNSLFYIPLESFEETDVP